MCWRVCRGPGESVHRLALVQAPLCFWDQLTRGGVWKMALWRLGEKFGTLSTPLLVKDLGKMRRCKEVEVALCISCDDKRCNVLNSNVVNSCGL